jgi:hypothetical protein
MEIWQNSIQKLVGAQHIVFKKIICMNLVNFFWLPNDETLPILLEYNVLKVLLNTLYLLHVPIIFNKIIIKTY